MKEVSALDISLALWALGLSSVSRDESLDAWGFGAPGSAESPLLGLDIQIEAELG